MLLDGSVVREFKLDGEGVPDGDGVAGLAAGVEWGEGFDDADGFGVEGGGDGTDDFDVANGAVRGDDELKDDAALDVSGSGVGGVLDVFGNVFHEGGIATGEGGHLFDATVDVGVCVRVGVCGGG